MQGLPIIGRDINRLNRCNRAIFCGCDSFLQFSKLLRQSRLIANSGRHTTEQSGYFTTCLNKTENIIDEKKNIFF